MFFDNKNIIDNKNTLLNIIPNEDLMEHKNVIKLMLFSNNYNKYDLNYIKIIYNLESFMLFRIFFKKNFKKKLIFNSHKSEKMFIDFVNYNTEYFNEKYGDKIHQTLFNFFIYGKKFYFNLCDELNHNDDNKNHCKNCKCTVKVKNINNLSITVFLDIISGKINTSKPTKTIKIKNNSINKDIISCFNNIKNIGQGLGIENDVNYILDSCTENSISSYKDDEVNNYTNKIKNNQQDIMNQILNKINTLEKTINNNPKNQIIKKNYSTLPLANESCLQTVDIDNIYEKELTKYEKLEKLGNLKKLNSEKKKHIIDIFKSDSSMKSILSNINKTTSKNNSKKINTNNNEINDNNSHKSCNKNNYDNYNESSNDDSNDDSNDSDDSDDDINDSNESNDSDNESSKSRGSDSNITNDNNEEDTEQMTGLYNYNTTDNSDEKNKNKIINEIDDFMSNLNNKKGDNIKDLFSNLLIEIRKNSLITENNSKLTNICDKIKDNIDLKYKKRFDDIYKKINKYEFIDDNIENTENYDKYYNLIQQIGQLNNDII